MALQGERIDITYDEQHRIVALDIYVPETNPNEIFIGMDLHEFSISHPLRGGVDITSLVYVPEAEGYEEYDPACHSGDILDSLSKRTDTLNFDDCFSCPEEAAASEELLQIKQHIGKIGTDSSVVALSTYSMKKAAEDLKAFYSRGEALEELVAEYYQSVN